jgi:hypothetical protein
MPKEDDINASNGSSPSAGRVGASPANGVMTTDDILLYIEQSTGPYGDTLPWVLSYIHTPYERSDMIIA